MSLMYSRIASSGVIVIASTSQDWKTNAQGASARTGGEALEEPLARLDPGSR
jgi:hypothetical protein